MGKALLSRWVKQGVDPNTISIIEPYNAEAGSEWGIKPYADLEAFSQQINPDAIIFAIKPQMLDEALPLYKNKYAAAKPCVVSTAAGKTTDYFHSGLGNQWPVIRVMPNTPAMVGMGMSVLFADKNSTAHQKNAAEHLFSAVGKTAWIEDEVLMDAVTALSGSGPAYVFHLLEVMSKAGVELGLDSRLAEQLALQTVRGAAELAEQGETSFDELRKQVTI